MMNMDNQNANNDEVGKDTNLQDPIVNVVGKRSFRWICDRIYEKSTSKQDLERIRTIGLKLVNLTNTKLIGMKHEQKLSDQMRTPTSSAEDKLKRKQLVQKHANPELTHQPKVSDKGFRQPQRLDAFSRLYEDHKRRTERRREAIDEHRDGLHQAITDASNTVHMSDGTKEIISANQSETTLLDKTPLWVQKQKNIPKVKERREQEKINAFPYKPTISAASKKLERNVVEDSKRFLLSKRDRIKNARDRNEEMLQQQCPFQPPDRSPEAGVSRQNALRMMARVKHGHEPPIALSKLASPKHERYPKTIGRLQSTKKWERSAAPVVDTRLRSARGHKSMAEAIPEEDEGRMSVGGLTVENLAPGKEVKALMNAIENDQTDKVELGDLIESEMAPDVQEKNEKKRNRVESEEGGADTEGETKKKREDRSDQPHRGEGTDQYDKSEEEKTNVQGSGEARDSSASSGKDVGTADVAKADAGKSEAEGSKSESGKFEKDSGKSEEDSGAAEDVKKKKSDDSNEDASSSKKKRKSDDDDSGKKKKKEGGKKKKRGSEEVDDDVSSEKKKKSKSPPVDEDAAEDDKKEDAKKKKKKDSDQDASEEDKKKKKDSDGEKNDKKQKKASKGEEDKEKKKKDKKD